MGLLPSPPIDPRTFQLDLPPARRPDDVMLVERWYPGVRECWARCSSRRIYDPIFGIKAIVIHATAGRSAAGAMSVMAAGTASFHWLVPDEDEPEHGRSVWACVPEARAARHVRNVCCHPAVNGGANKVNHWSLGIEIVNAQTRSDGFSSWQIEATARIVRYCWAKYPNLRHVVSHARLDPERRTDPGEGFPWGRFAEAVLESAGERPVSV